MHFRAPTTFRIFTGWISDRIALAIVSALVIVAALRYLWGVLR